VYVKVFASKRTEKLCVCVLNFQPNTLYLPTA